MKKVFISGANGFVGEHLCKYFDRMLVPYIAGVRFSSSDKQVSYGEFTEVKDWSIYLADCDQVVHLANRAHVMNDTSKDPIETFRKVNTKSTTHFAENCKSLGIKRFIFISSIKVNGEQTNHRPPFNADEMPNPQDGYAISKHEAEQKLMALHEPGKFEVVIIRPPLIYGKSVKGNLSTLIRLIQKKCPLPFGSLKNRRSLISIANLCNLILICLKNPAAGGQIFLASDDQDLSLKELVLKLATVLKTTAFLFPFPIAILKCFADLIGKSALNDRLFGNLQIDIEKTKHMLNWKPPYSFEDTFENTLPEKN